MARALQFFAPGIPQVYYVGLLAGTNKYECAEETGDGREINRYNYSLGEIGNEITREVVQRLFWLINFRNRHLSFGENLENLSETDVFDRLLDDEEKKASPLDTALKTQLQKAYRELLAQCQENS